jgi:hypothetical protein
MSEKKFLPHALYKQQLVNLYAPMPKRSILYEINRLLVKNEISVHKQFIPNKVFKDFVDFIGLPKGYVGFEE